MIYPTPRAIILAVAGAPAALLIGIVAPALWSLGVGWIAAVILLCLLDSLLGASPVGAQISVRPPSDLGVGGGAERLDLSVSFTARRPTQVELAPDVTDHISLTPRRRRVAIKAGEGGAAFSLVGARRGDGRFNRLWMRWTGPMGLMFKQRIDPMGIAIPVTADIRGVRQAAVRLFSRDAVFGLKAQIDLGDGAEYNALREYQPGMDPRAIDWKQSARHGTILVKEFRTERNHPIVIVLDTGRLMSEPVAGLPRLDRALNAALLLAYVCLKIGDRVGLFAFDALPRLATGVVTGVAAFGLLQRQSALIDYSNDETNFTLGLTTLQGQLDRRSLIVVFSEFADPTNAELMLENVGRLLKRHAVLFVVLHDEELEALAKAHPETADDVARSVVAGALLRERQSVLNRLRRMGADIVEAPAERISAALLDRYLALKRSGRL